MVKPPVLFIVLLSTVDILYVTAEGCDKKGTLFYEDLGCKPKSTEGNCPTSFECGSLDRTADHCALRGKSLEIGEHADSYIQGWSCNAGCFCAEPQPQRGNKADFVCAILDCPEFLGHPLKPGCFRKYELGECCSVGQTCPPFDNLATCEYEGKTYKEGEKFYPEGTCQKCVCQKGFTGELEKPFCDKFVCGAQLKNSDKLEQYCAPVYGISKTSDVLCCPTFYICPAEGDVFTAVPCGNADKTCKFGEKEVKIGQKLKRTDNQLGVREVECECKIPPFLTCTTTF